MISVIVHRFKMGDVEDPDLWAASSFYEWEHSEKGVWVMNNTSNPTWHRHPHEFGWMYTITAQMNEKQHTYYKLKYE